MSTKISPRFYYCFHVNIYKRILKDLYSTGTGRIKLEGKGKEFLSPMLFKVVLKGRF